jgi:membrane protease YdiL (CAAX protease family)
MATRQLYLTGPLAVQESGKGSMLSDDTHSLLWQALAALEGTDADRGADAARLALALAGGPGRDRMRGWATWILALAHLATQDVLSAVLYLRRAETLAQQTGDAALAAEVARGQHFAQLCQKQYTPDEAATSPDTGPTTETPEFAHHFQALLASSRQALTLPALGRLSTESRSGLAFAADTEHAIRPLAVAPGEAIGPLVGGIAPVQALLSRIGRPRRGIGACFGLWSRDWHAWSLAAYLLLITLAELVTSLASPQLGVVLHASILLLIPIHFAFAQQRNSPYAPLILTLALAPLVRLMSLTLPLARLPFVTWYIIIAIPLFAAAFAVSRALGLTWAQVGLTIRLRDLPRQSLIALTGMGLGVIEFLILHPAALVPDGNLALVGATALILLVGTGILEEVIFRGVMQHVALKALGARGLIYVSLIFAALHIGYLSIVDLIFVFCVGMFFGWLVRCTGSILGVVIAHGLTNTFLYLVMPTVGLALLPFLR